MKTENIQVYKCDYCNKMYQRKHFCIKHEAGCKNRPDYIRPCHNCKVLKKVKATIPAGYGDQNGCEMETNVKVLFCEKLDCFIHPPSVATKGNAFNMGDKDNIEMPKQCEYFDPDEFITGEFDI